MPREAKSYFFSRKGRGMLFHTLLDNLQKYCLD